MEPFLSLDDFAPAARRRLPRGIFDFIAGGAEDGLSLRSNRQSFERIRFQPRVLRDTSARSIETTTLGQGWAAPFGIAPMGAAGVAGFRADLSMARAAAKANIPFVLSGSSVVALERVIVENPRTWFQMYASTQADENEALIQRVLASGCQTLVITVDVPVGGNRERDIRNGYASPLRPNLRLALDCALHPRWLVGSMGRTLWHEGLPHFENFAAGRAPMISMRATRTHRRDNLSWDILKSIRARWPHRLILKGILSSEDVQLAQQIGVDAVVASNHGGRQLDGAIEPMAVLPGMVACRGEMEIFLDSGVRRGTDILKAVALGSGHVFIGRPFLYAAAVGGEAGVSHAIQLLRSELERNMALLGCKRLVDVRDCVFSV